MKPFSEEFVLAESAASGQAPGGSMDSLVDAQKQIIASTWNIERRTIAGRSSDDVRTVAEAQAALKSRAEQVSSSRPRRRSATPPPESVSQRPAGAAESDPIREAVQAMEQAVQQLQTERTAEALPHEMAALNALLQAQAEARRREVLRQQANGGGNGSGRSGQDLSALFDKELQRQQKTNYETPPNAEAVDKQPDANDALFDRIRDLARRQEELSRRQAELARSGSSAEQLQRELEKLTREQAALRQEAEELARRGAQSSVGDAARQMAEATGELRRANPEAAARDGERAAAQLRRAEGQAPGRGAGTTERARTDAQIEGQQIAQEQRRIAAQAERLDRAGRPAAGEARRQLADDKGRLADRVDELRRAIGDGAETPSGGGSRRDLEDIARQMRESARRLRDGSRGDVAIAPPEHDLARAVEDAIGQLPSSGDPGRAQLSKKLAGTRAIRDRLERLEQQMRAAAAASPAPGGRDAGRSGGQSGATRANPASTDARRTAEDYRRELEKARQALDQLAGMEATSGSGGGMRASRARFCSWYWYFPKSMMRQTGGTAVGEISTRSSPFCLAIASACGGGMMPSCAPVSSITRISRTRMRSLTRTRSSRRGLLSKAIRPPTLTSLHSVDAGLELLALARDFVARRRDERVDRLAPWSPPVRVRTDTVPSALSRSPTTSM